MGEARTPPAAQFRLAARSPPGRQPRRGVGDQPGLRRRFLRRSAVDCSAGPGEVAAPDHQGLPGHGSGLFTRRTGAGLPPDGRAVVEGAAVCCGGRRRRAAGHYRPASRRGDFLVVPGLAPDRFQLPRTRGRTIRHRGRHRGRSRRTTAYYDEPVQAQRGGLHPRQTPSAVHGGGPRARWRAFGSRCRRHVQLTSLTTDVASGTFSADGSAVYFAAAPPADDDGLAASIYRVPSTGGEPAVFDLAAGSPQSVLDVRESRDGRWLFYIARDSACRAGTLWRATPCFTACPRAAASRFR